MITLTADETKTVRAAMKMASHPCPSLIGVRAIAISTDDDNNVVITLANTPAYRELARWMMRPHHPEPET